MYKPLCFIIMPFGKKKDLQGNEFDFNFIFENLIKPAVEKAGMEAIRADKETVGGIIHKPMYERLILCDYAIADLTAANANVFYELGVRHTVKPYSTIPIFASGGLPPFDVNHLRCMPYHYDPDPAQNDFTESIEAIADALMRAKKEKHTDSPVYQLVDGIAFQNSVAHEKTDIFRDQVMYNQQLKQQLRTARNTPGHNAAKLAAVEAVLHSLGSLENEEAGVLIDVMLCFRELKAWDRMIAFIELLPRHVQETVMVQEQYGFALNRVGRWEDAVAALQKVLDEHGPSSETYGILGRVYKDKYDTARSEGSAARAKGFLDKALDAYSKGFEADWRDAYPGINAVTLYALKGDTEKAKALSPVVAYSVKRKMATKTPDYWDYAILLELSVLEDDQPAAADYLSKALACEPAGWMTDTTQNNLRLIINSRKERGAETDWLERFVGEVN
jgi:tetratricopeptide (TPR) repeat protein